MCVCSHVKLTFPPVHLHILHGTTAQPNVRADVPRPPKRDEFLGHKLRDRDGYELQVAKYSEELSNGVGCAVSVPEVLT